MARPVVGDVVKGFHCICIRELPNFYFYLSFWLTFFCYQKKNLGVNLPAPLDNVHNGYVGGKLNKHDTELVKN